MIQELPVVDGRYAGGAFEWVTLFSVLCGVGTMLGYALLGAAWLVLKGDGELRDWAYRRLPWLLGGVVIILTSAFVFAVTSHLRVFDRWLADARLLVLPAAALLAIAGLGLGIYQRQNRVPFPMAALAVMFAFLTLAASFWPYMVPYTVTLHDAAAPRQSLAFLFWGCGLVVFPVVLIYTGAVFWIFHGKTSQVTAEYAAKANPVVRLLDH